MAQGRGLAIGEMAKLCCTSVRTLRFYQEKGLIEPTYVDEQTGRRYYEVSQAATVEMVSRLQGAGFSLDDIRQVSQEHDVAALRDRMAAQIEALEQQIALLERSRAVARDTLTCCEAYLGTPVRNRILFENAPDRQVILLDPPSADERDAWRPHSFGDQMELYQCHMRAQIVRRGYPLVVGRNAGILVPPDQVAPDVDLFAQTPYVVADAFFDEAARDAVVLPGGQSLVLYLDVDQTPDSQGLHRDCIERLLNYMAVKGLEMMGPLTSECLFRFERYFDISRYPFYRIAVPVRSHNSWSAFFDRPEAEGEGAR